MRQREAIELKTKRKGSRRLPVQFVGGEISELQTNLSFIRKIIYAHNNASLPLLLSDDYISIKTYCEKAPVAIALRNSAHATIIFNSTILRVLRWRYLGKALSTAITFSRQPAAGGHHGGGDEEEGHQRLAEQQERQGGADKGGQGVVGAGAGGVIECLSCGWGWCRFGA